MKAVYLDDAKKVSLVEVPVSKPGNGEVLLKVKAVSICGSDIKRVIEGHRKMPIILGHECSGEVAEVGEGVDFSLVGTRAAIIPLIPCFKCEQCKKGLFSACKHYSFIGSRQDGCFAEFVVVPTQNLLPIGNNVDFEDAALLEPLTVIIHGLNRIDPLHCKSVAVIGVGSLGALAIKWLKTIGFGNILASDVDENRLEHAKKIGASITINPERTDVISEVMKVTDGGFDLVIESAGTPQALQNAISIARPRAKILLFGNLPKNTSIPGELFEQLLRNELFVYGNWMSYSDPFPGEEWRESLEAIESRSLSLTNIISHRFPLSEAPAVFEKIIHNNLSFRKIMLFPDENNGMNS